jgi:hypothetical protein
MGGHQVVVREIHHVMAKEAVEAVAKEATSEALRKIRLEAAMMMLVVARESSKVAMREHLHGIVAREAATWMYAADAAMKEACVADVAKAASFWVSLIDSGDETEVEDGDNNDEVDTEYMVFVDRGDVQREPLMDRVVVSSAHAAAELTERHREEELVVASAARAMANLAQANAKAAAH